MNDYYNIGLAYNTGRGVPTNYQQAMQWYRKAAEYYEKAAKAGSTRGVFNYALALSQGKGVEKSESGARQLMQMLANRGDNDAKAWLDYH